MIDYLPPARDACGDSDDEVVTAAERSEPRDPRQQRPLDILIAREAAVIRIAVAVEARSTFHRSPPWAAYYDAREDDRRQNAAMAAEARREAWAERRAAMMTAGDTDRRHL